MNTDSAIGYSVAPSGERTQLFTASPENVKLRVRERHDGQWFSDKRAAEFFEMLCLGAADVTLQQIHPHMLGIEIRAPQISDAWHRQIQAIRDAGVGMPLEFRLDFDMKVSDACYSVRLYLCIATEIADDLIKAQPFALSNGKIAAFKCMPSEGKRT